jgi:hypothetical protein
MAGPAVVSFSRRVYGYFAIFLAGVFLFYRWTPGSSRQQFLDRMPHGLYNELSDALISGQLSLKRLPDPRLVELANPYDPAENFRYRVNNLSYYGGHYFVYMGAVPALAIFIPVRLLTGEYLRQDVAISIFNTIGVAAGVGLLLRIWKRCMRVAPCIVVVIAALALALANGYYVTIRGDIAQEVAISGAYAFGMVALWAAGGAVTSEQYPGRWLVLAGISVGCAIGSRPNYLFASAFLLLPILYCCRRDGIFATKLVFRYLVATTTPLAIILGLIIEYNRVRFGHPFEFGQRYILGAWNQSGMPNFTLANVSENVWRYLVAPAFYSQYFPFVKARSWIAVSVIPHVPWLWLMPIAAWSLARRSTPGPVRAIGFSALLFAALNFLTLIFLPSGDPGAVSTSANARYLLDFQPGFALFVAIGVLTLRPASVTGDRVWSLCFVPFVMILTLISILIALSLDIGRFDPSTYRPFAFVLNFPAYVGEVIRGESYGPLDVDLYFPNGKSGGYEPIVSTGGSSASDLLYVNYSSPTAIRFGFVSGDFRGPLSAPVSIDYQKQHHLVVNMGSLLPKDGHPSWIAFEGGAIAFLERDLRVELDGNEILDCPVYFHPSSPNEVRIAQNPFLFQYAARHFSGRIIASTRLALPTTYPKEAAFGAICLELKFPSNAELNVREPLVVTGVPMAGDFVYVEYLGNRTVRFGIDHWGGPGIETGIVDASTKSVHTVIISMASLYPKGTREADSQRVKLIFDGRTVFDGIQETFESPSYDVEIGKNPIGGSTCGYSFTGRILNASRLASSP